MFQIITRLLFKVDKKQIQPMKAFWKHNYAQCGYFCNHINWMWDKNKNHLPFLWLPLIFWEWICLLLKWIFPTLCFPSHFCLFICETYAYFFRLCVMQRRRLQCQVQESYERNIEITNSLG